jgi:MYXO-CTERM domain-containing protein
MAQGGVVIGLLLARTLSGVVADAPTGAPYFVSAALACALLLLLWRGCRRR